MMEYTIETSRAYYRTILYSVEAGSIEEARAKFLDGGIEEDQCSSLNWDGEEEIMAVYEEEA